MVLVADDDRDVLAELVRELGASFKVVAVRSVAEALAALAARGERYVGVVSDLHFFGEARHGLDLLHEVRVRFPQCARVLISSDLQRDTCEAFESIGDAHRCLAKPLTRGAVHAAVIDVRRKLAGVATS